MSNGSATWTDSSRPVHRRDVGACEFPIGGSSSSVAVAMRQEQQPESGALASDGTRQPPSIGDMSLTSEPANTATLTQTPRDNEAIGSEMATQIQPLLPAVALAQRLDGTAGFLSVGFPPGLALLLGQCP
jgi:hypothetical protein